MQGAWHLSHGSGVRITISSTSSTGHSKRVWPIWPGCPPRRRWLRRRRGRGAWGRSLEGGRDAWRERWLSCSCQACPYVSRVWTIASKTTTQASSVPIEACTAAGVCSQRSWGSAGGVSINTEYARRREKLKDKFSLPERLRRSRGRLCGGCCIW